MNSKIDVCFISIFLLWHGSFKKKFESANFVVGSTDFSDIEGTGGSNLFDIVSAVRGMISELL